MTNSERIKAFILKHEAKINWILANVKKDDMVNFSGIKGGSVYHRKVLAVSTTARHCYRGWQSDQPDYNYWIGTTDLKDLDHWERKVLLKTPQVLILSQVIESATGREFLQTATNQADNMTKIKIGSKWCRLSELI